MKEMSSLLPVILSLSKDLSKQKTINYYSVTKQEYILFPAFRKIDKLNNGMDATGNNIKVTSREGGTIVLLGIYAASSPSQSTSQPLHN